MIMLVKKKYYTDIKGYDHFCVFFFYKSRHNSFMLCCFLKSYMSEYRQFQDLYNGWLSRHTRTIKLQSQTESQVMNTLCYSSSEQYSEVAV